VAPPAVPTVTPTELPTSVAVDALDFGPTPEQTRVHEIRFTLGSTNSTVGGFVDYERPIRYVLAARAGQPMTVVLQNQGGYLAMVEISTEEGVFLGAAIAGKTWSGVLPATQNYHLTVRVPAGGTGHDFSLWVEILP
jgi:hypothetical protein